jgi:hypothetical protein
MTFRYKLVLLLILNVIVISEGIAQRGNVYVDHQGVMRWEQNKAEVKGFGVNYSVPFAHAYRSAKKLGIDPKEAIDNDVYHFTRLGFDLYRLHVWDTQISDVEGNLIENEYLDTFDYLLHKLTENNINYVITPIAFWGDGWPEPNTETPGFSHKYGKDECLTNPDAIKAQQNYLYQFLNHVNPYKSVAYKDDPSVIAFEISNEPHHSGDPKEVTKFVAGMVKAMKRTKTKKPIFYNMSHGVHFADDYFKGGVQGGTFQWYPTGLGYQREIPGNLLPNVNDYHITFEDSFKKHKSAKLVYEFDAADVNKSYIYPAMARSFRTAGIQIATHFAYDPTFLAYANTEYNTHYMNLVYTPQKALSLKICAEVFREIPMYSDFGTYPENTVFGNFKVDYESDLAIYNSEEKFFYTNSHAESPKDQNKLKEIAGFGNSTLINYTGTGAYFLDKIEDGLWRLEVLPDAVLVDNPFGRNSLNKTVSVVNWETHDMTINLNDLGNDFKIEGINQDNNYSKSSEGDSFQIKPGTYILSNVSTSGNWNATNAFKTHQLNSFFAPKSTVEQAWLKHEPQSACIENAAVEIAVQYVAPSQPKSIKISGFSGGQRVQFELNLASAYHYKDTIPANILKEGFFEYYIIVETETGDAFTYPSGQKGQPTDWDFYDRSTYKSKVLKPSYPIYLFDALEDSKLLVAPWRGPFKLLPTQHPNEAIYEINVEKLWVEDTENLNAEPIYDYSFKHFVLDKIEGVNTLSNKNRLVLKGKSLNNKNCKLRVAFVMKGGAAYGGLLELKPELTDYSINLSDLKPVKTVTLPRPYPTFLPYYFEHNNQSDFNVENIESIQFSIGPEIEPARLKEPHGVGIVHVRLQ